VCPPHSKKEEGLLSLRVSDWLQEKNFSIRADGGCWGGGGAGAEGGGGGWGGIG